MIQDHEKNPMHGISFSAYVEGVRKYLGLTQAELGARMNNRTSKTISRWETGETMPDEVPVVMLALKGLVLEKTLHDTKNIPFFVNTIQSPPVEGAKKEMNAENMTLQTPAAVYERLAHLINEQEYHKISALFTKDATVIPPHKQPATNARKGIERIQGAFRQHQRYTVKYKINEVEMHGEDKATVRYSWTGNGNMGTYTFDGADTVARQPGGVWLITHNDAFHTPRYEASGKPIDFE